MNNLGPSIEKIFGIILILIGSFIIMVFIMATIDPEEFTGSIMTDLLMTFTIGLLPL